MTRARRRAARGLLCAAMAGAGPGSGAGDDAEGGWRGAADATLYVAAEGTRLTDDSRLNPGNAFAHLAERAFSAEARLRLAAGTQALQFSARPILPARWADDGRGARDAHQAYLSEWRARAPLGEAVALSLGRERMHWGPAQFRSPSSPFYFANGRDNPSRELSGVDALKLAYTPDANHLYTLAWIQDSGHLAPADDAWKNAWLGKAERRADDWAASAVLAQARGRAPFVGLYAQWTLDERWLLYGEAASATRAQALLSPADVSQPFSVRAESARHLTAVLGASFTFESGRALSVEWLRDGHGYHADAAGAYFARAARSPAEAALALSRMPPLLGRHYLHVVWQNSPLADEGYWRVQWSRNLVDHGDAFALYLERPLDARLSVYALAAAHRGGPAREFSALTEHSLLVGLRLALP